MSADNSVTPAPLDAVAEARPPFSIPDDLSTRYNVRVIDASDHSERTLGLFLARDRTHSTLEIRDERIVARREDRETIASLVTLAKHNAWDRIDIDGSANFRKALWEAATREGLSVRGYEPTFADHERTKALGHQAARVERDRADEAGSNRAGERQSALSDGDRRLLLALSRHLEDQKMLSMTLDAGLNGFQREVQTERIEQNRRALEAALERALESPALDKAFRQAGFEPDTLRAMRKQSEGNGQLAIAVYQARDGLDPRKMTREAGAEGSPAVERDLTDADPAAAGPVERAAQNRELEAGLVRPERQRDEAAKRQHEGAELAELFLHGAVEKISADPRLANAVRAQGAMAHHIAELFEGDATKTAAATFESRQMISDVLRRGLDVAVREQTSARQREPLQTLEMER